MLENEGVAWTTKVLCTQLMCVAVVASQLQHCGVQTKPLWDHHSAQLQLDEFAPNDSLAMSHGDDHASEDQIR